MKKVKKVIFETDYFVDWDDIDADDIDSQRVAEVVCQESMNEFINCITLVRVLYDDGTEDKFTTKGW